MLRKCQPNFYYYVKKIEVQAKILFGTIQKTGFSSYFP